MPRISRGSVFRRSESGSFYIQFSIDGELKRESAGTTDRDAAIEFLQRRLDEARNGRYVEADAVSGLVVISDRAVSRTSRPGPVTASDWT